MALFFAALNRHLLLVKPHRLREELPLERRRQILARSVSGVIPYAIATALAVVSSYADARDLRRRWPCSTRSRSPAAERPPAHSAGSLPPPRAEHPAPVVPRDRRQLALVEPGRGERVEQLRRARHVARAAPGSWRRRSRSRARRARRRSGRRRSARASAISCQRRVGVVGEVRPQERAPRTRSRPDPPDAPIASS